MSRLSLVASASLNLLWRCFLDPAGHKHFVGTSACLLLPRDKRLPTVFPQQPLSFDAGLAAAAERNPRPGIPPPSSTSSGRQELEMAEFGG